MCECWDQGRQDENGDNEDGGNGTNGQQHEDCPPLEPQEQEEGQEEEKEKESTDEEMVMEEAVEDEQQHGNPVAAMMPSIKMFVPPGIAAVKSVSRSDTFLTLCVFTCWCTSFSGGMKLKVLICNIE